MKRLLAITFTFVTGMISSPLMAASVADSIEIIDPYVRMIPPGAPATAAFMQIQNKDGKNHALVSAKGSINKITELHTHIHNQGVMQMRQVKQIDLPAGKTTSLQPGGLHVMLIDLQEPVEQGQTVKINLTFEDGSTKTITAEGRPIKPMGMGKGMGMKMGAGMELSNGRNSNPMSMVMHANPAFPNLTGVAIKNAGELGLSSEQVSQLKAWTQKHGDTMQKNFQQVKMLEQGLIQDSLAGMSKSDLMAKFEKTLALRKEIAETKIDCRDNMKKILTEKQFKKLASIYPMM